MKNQDSGSKKKGQIDIILIVVLVLVTFSIITYIGYGVVSDINDELQLDSSINNLTKNISATTTAQYPSFNDGIFALAFGLFWIGIIVAAFFSEANPFFFVIFVIVIIALMLASGMISNMWDDFSADAAYSGYDVQFPVTNYVMDNFMLVLGVQMFSGFITLFLKQRLI